MLRGQAGEGDGEIAIRPHALALATPGAPVDSDRTWIEGVVETREFLGEFVRYVIRLKGETITADEPHFSDRATYVPGNTVRVGIDPARLRLFPASSTSLPVPAQET